MTAPPTEHLQFSIPPALAERVNIPLVHPWPRVGNEIGIIQPRRLEAVEAWENAYQVEVNTSGSVTVLLYDVDERGAHKLKTVLASPTPPNWAQVNTVNGHYHCGFILNNPVARHDAAGAAAFKFMQDVDAALELWLLADPAYPKLLMHNPLHPAPGRRTIWIRREGYDLGDFFAAGIPRAPRANPILREREAESANPELFAEADREALRPRSYRLIEQGGAYGAWLGVVRRLNREINRGRALLPDEECRSIAASTAQRALAHHDPAVFSAIQRRRSNHYWGRIKGTTPQDRSAAVLELSASGRTAAAIADETGITKRHVYRIIADEKKGGREVQQELGNAFRLPGIMRLPKEDRRYPLAQAKIIAEELRRGLASVCERIDVAGSIRRGKSDVGDIELLVEPKGDGIALDTAIHELLTARVLALRVDKNGRTSYGGKNKLLVHVDSHIPVDVFTTGKENWGMAMVVRTGPKSFNQALMARFKSLGMRGHAYGGVTARNGEEMPCPTEETVFALAEWPLMLPEERETKIPA